MHQLSERRVIPNRIVDVNDMRSVVEKFFLADNHSFDKINRLIHLQNVVLRDEDDISFGQGVRVFARQENVRVEHATVVSGALDVCAAVLPLNLNVEVLAVSRHRVNVKANAAPLEIYERVLDADALNF